MVQTSLERGYSTARFAWWRPAGVLKATGEDALDGRPAIPDIPVGKRRVVSYNCNPMHRDLNRSDCRPLWNAIINRHALVR